MIRLEDLFFDTQLSFTSLEDFENYIHNGRVQPEELQELKECFEGGWEFSITVYMDVYDDGYQKYADFEISLDENDKTIIILKNVDYTRWWR